MCYIVQIEFIVIDFGLRVLVPSVFSRTLCPTI